MNYNQTISIHYYFIPCFLFGKQKRILNVYEQIKTESGRRLLHLNVDYLIKIKEIDMFVI